MAIKNEEWRSAGNYQISNRRRVKSLDKFKQSGKYSFKRVKGVIIKNLTEDEIDNLMIMAWI